MRTNRIKLLAGIGAASALALSLAPRASALTVFGPIFLPNFCPTPSVATCQTESMQTDLCATENEQACVPILQQAFEANVQNPSASGGSAQSIPLPGSVSSTGAPTVVTGAVLPYDERKIAFTSSDAEYESLMTARRMPKVLNLGFASAIAAANTSAIDPATWEANGGAINAVNLVGAASPCAEYAYEKYYGYERFQDAAATCLDNAACIYNVGALTTTPGLDQTSLSKRDGTAMTVQVQSLPPVSNLLKNAFFSNQLQAGSTSPSLSPITALWTLAWAHASAPPGLAAALSAASETLGSGFAYNAPNRMAWHVQMHGAQAAEDLTAADYASQDARMAAYAKLYEQAAGYASVLPSATVYEALNGVATTTCGTTKSTGVNAPPPILTNPGNPNSSGSGSTSCTTTIGAAPYPAGSAAAMLAQTALEMAEALIAEWNHVNPVTNVVDHGCLDPTSVRCDWEPKMFVSDYSGLFQSQRQADYDRCVADTGDDLLVGANSSLPVTSAALASTSAFETYLTSLEAKYKAETANIPWLTASGATGPTAGTIGVDRVGGNSVGDPSSFSAQYNYETEWLMSFTQANNQVCAGTGEIKASVNASASVFGSTSTLVDGLFQATDGPSGATLNTHLTLLGNSVFTPVSASLGSGANAWNLAPEGNTINGPSFSAPPIIVFGIPIVVSAGINFNYGVNGSASATEPTECMNASGSGTFMQIQGTISPYANAQAFASASVDLAIASAGIQTNVTLLQVALPVTGTLAMNYLNGDAQVSIDVTPALQLSELSGSVDAYASFLTYTARTTLFSWSGATQNVGLGSLDDTYSLGAINYWVNGHGG